MDQSEAAAPSAPPSLACRTAIVAASLAALAATVLIGLGAETWVGQTFPGFFVLPNRVIPSIGRSAWSGTTDGALYQQAVVALDGTGVDGNGAAYRRIALRPAGAPVTYTLRHGAATETLTLATRVFSRSDYWAIFGGYLATGLLYLLLGLLAAWLLPDEGLGRALLLLGATGGIYALTGVGIYAAGADLRLHVLAESFLPATMIHLALVIRRVERSRLSALAMLGVWLSLALAIPYELLLDQPTPYSVLHAACEIYLGVAGLAVGVALISERTRAGASAGPFLRAGVAGALLGLGVPGLIMVLSGLSGGRLPVNVMTATAFLFPLSLGYGLVRERLFHQIASAPVAA